MKKVIAAIGILLALAGCCSVQPKPECNRTQIITYTERAVDQTTFEDARFMYDACIKTCRPPFGDNPFEDAANQAAKEADEKFNVRP